MHEGERTSQQAQSSSASLSEYCTEKNFVLPWPRTFVRAACVPVPLRRCPSLLCDTSPCFGIRAYKKVPISTQLFLLLLLSKTRRVTYSLQRKWHIKYAQEFTSTKIQKFVLYYYFFNTVAMKGSEYSSNWRCFLKNMQIITSGNKLCRYLVIANASDTHIAFFILASEKFTSQNSQ